MFILVDYDNILLNYRSKGILYIVDRLLHVLGFLKLKESKRAHIRLYGGWFADSSLTMKAQDLSVDIQNFFPRRIRFVEGHNVLSLILTVELARSLVMIPNFDLQNTYRHKSMPRGLRCAHPNQI